MNSKVSLVFWLILLVSINVQARDEIKNTKQMQVGKQYTFYRDGSCTDSSEAVCITANEYKTICKFTKGLTQNLPKMMSVFASKEDETLLTAGEFSDIEVAWGKSLGGAELCFFEFTSSGMYQGNSKRKTFQGVVAQFIKNGKGQVLAHNRLP
jgi:hypothetical protein